MPLSTLDPACALIVVDLQKGVTARPEIKDALDNSVALATEFRRCGLPVVLVTVDGSAPGRTDAHQGTTAANRPPRPADWAEPAPELDAQPTDIRIAKQRWGAFIGTGLQQQLQDRGVTQTVITGVATSIGVESTARSAHEHGYHVVLATDAVADLNPEAHRNSVERIFPRLGETATTADILTALRTRANA
ncbi:isochorismatase family protein [Actinoallomurus rhizosphaericola]|uniref:isochorismatase family protein n=1 Tax=Actinoallomurus rhizosphaericola TaxID=2952536 RepID=UPI0020925226|nr:isochorismatase family protein [Actinoallomurus rhizosphaericola]MCO5998919.1 isochorismatase family protein [Actinoallomurus rhizosphaericola]